MRLRQLVLACSLTTFILSSGANALGLGEASVKSSLNQPLQAEIKLLDTRDLTAEQVMVALASPADFERNGIDRPYFYTEFQFDVRLDAPDGPKVIVTSYSPVREPYLNFLIEAKWSAGRLLREYTLLMDLPNFDDNRVAPTIAAAPVAAPKSLPKAQPQPSASKPKPAVARVADISADQYKVQANDTLWEIARRASRSSGASIHQTMMAIYEANPDAFINQNINLLRRGQVLRIPSGQEQAARSSREAVAQFAQLSQSNGATHGAQLDASSRQLGSQSAAQESQGRVTLSASARGEGQGSGADKGRTAALENELNTTLEELDRSRSENAELSSRVRDLEEQVQTMESLVALSNEKLKAMQVAAQQANNLSDAANEDTDAAELQASAASAAQSSLPETTAEAEESAFSSEAAVVAAPAPASQAASSAASSVAAVAPRGPVRAPTWTDNLAANAPWLGLAAALVLGAGYVFFRRRKEQEENEFQEDFTYEPDVDTVDAEPEFEPEPQYKEETIEDLIANDPVDDDESGVSALDRADIYVGFGQYDRAEAVLEKALSLEPENTACRDKLIEVYEQQGKKEQAQSVRDSTLAVGAVVAATSAVAAHSSDDQFTLDDLSEDVDDLSLDLEGEDFNFDLSLDDLSLDDNKDQEEEIESLSLQDADTSLEDDFSTFENSTVTDDAARSSVMDDLDNLEFDEKLVLDEMEDEVLPTNFSDALFPTEDVKSPLDEDFDLELNAGELDLASLDNEISELDLAEPLSLEPSLEDDLDEALFESDLANLEAAFDADDLLKTLDDSSLTTAIEPTSSLEEKDEAQALGFSEEDLANLESAFDTSELDLLNETDSLGDTDTTSANIGEVKDDVIGASVEDSFDLTDDLSLFDPEVGAVGGFAADDFTSTDEELDDEFDFLADADEAATKLDLARAYLDMGDAEGARDILDEVLAEGNDNQKAEASELLKRLDA